MKTDLKGNILSHVYWSVIFVRGNLGFQCIFFGYFSIAKKPKFGAVSCTPLSSTICILIVLCTTFPSFSVKLFFFHARTDPYLSLCIHCSPSAEFHFYYFCCLCFTCVRFRWFVCWFVRAHAECMDPTDTA